MKSNQKLSLLFWLWRSKASKTDGRAPIYARITIDGLDDELSTSRKVLPEHWDNQLKIVTDPSPEGRKTNKKIIEMRTDLELHFRALQNQFEEVTPGMLKNVYKGIPANGIQENTDKPVQSDHTLLEAIDLLIVDFKEQVKEGTRSEQTLKQWRATRQKIIEFAKYKSSNDGSIRAIDLQREEDTDPDKFKIWVKSLDSEFGNEFYKYSILKRRDFLVGTKLKRRPINLLEAAARKQRIQNR
ncbi:Arm DNA-binding domain-containing protein [Chitinophaga polysaccharea]|uniref:Arm DNA-binding domain-containing protein n=1 Tax=Chitinophaga polysaccharea TaxID=1293035 RepID=UPI00115B97EA|nr:Arm DNA-binding domain-containing protein [Chitinophaga polysaccharea]